VETLTAFTSHWGGVRYPSNDVNGSIALGRKGGPNVKKSMKVLFEELSG